MLNLTRRPAGLRPPNSASSSRIGSAAKRGWPTGSRSHAAVAPRALPQVQGFQGAVVKRGDAAYEEKHVQYATTSVGRNGSMEPAAIYYPTGDADVKAVIDYARNNKLAVAVRTGGHQYTGASSTCGSNVQLDMGSTYGAAAQYDEKTGIVTVGISRRLAVLNRELRKFRVFVPHGQCSHVNVGGHAHTGGYGLPGRAFGLFADHIVAVRVFTADGQVRWYQRDAQDTDEADVFYAVLGGSPGNFGVLTHIQLKVHKDSDHPDSRGMKIWAPYDKDALTSLLQIKAEMADDPALPRDFDLCLTVISLDPLNSVQDDKVTLPAPGAAINMPSMAPMEAEPKLQKDAATLQRLAVEDLLIKYGVLQAEIDIYMDHLHEESEAPSSAAGMIRPAALPFLPKINIAPAMIFVWAEWANTNSAEKYDRGGAAGQWFQRIKDAVPGFGRWVQFDDEHAMDMSELTYAWTFPVKREFGLPYDKRTWVTKSTSLSKSGWVDFTANQIDKLVGKYSDALRVVVQIQNYGGADSAYAVNDKDNRTSYSWRRDSTVVQVMDCFYKDHATLLTSELTAQRARHLAEDWQRENDEALIGPQGNFSPGEDRRLLWASYYTANPLADGSDMADAWPFYYDSREKYERLRAIKARIDPQGVFTPNKFSVRPAT